MIAHRPSTGLAPTRIGHTRTVDVDVDGSPAVASHGPPSRGERRTGGDTATDGARARRTGPRAGTLGGSNRMLSARDVGALLAVPERTVRDKWREWDLPAYRIGKHLRWRERDVLAWIERQAALQQ